MLHSDSLGVTKSHKMPTSTQRCIPFIPEYMITQTFETFDCLSFHIIQNVLDMYMLYPEYLTRIGFQTISDVATHVLRPAS